MLNNQPISEILSVPVENIEAVWPSVRDALATLGMRGDLVEAGALATIRVETGSFKSISERYNGDPYTYFEGMYGFQTARGKRLGNMHPGDGWKFHGRGLIQLTGYANYLHMGNHFGWDLVQNPDMALEPEAAAAIFARFFYESKAAEACLTENWQKVRKRVNGGLNGWDEFIWFIDRIRAAQTLGSKAEGL